MAAHRPKAPAWYPDPDIHPGSANLLRYWNGRHWTDRRRPIPVLISLDLGTIGFPPLRILEGPARTEELRAPAAEVTATRDGGGLSDTRDRLIGSELRGVDVPKATGSGGGPPPERPELGGGGGGGGGDDGDDGAADAGASRLRRRKWWFFSGVAVLAAVAMALAGQAIRPASPGPKVLTDAHFVKLANDLCAKSLPTLRPPDGGQLPAKVTPAQSADQIDKAAVGLDDLANQLAALPAAPADQPHITTWLDEWHRYAASGHAYAADLRSHGANGREPKSLRTAAGLAQTTDNFSRANGLTGCLFAYSYVPDPSQF